MKNLIVVSADAHAGAQTVEDYREYFDPQYRYIFEEQLLDDEKRFLQLFPALDRMSHLAPEVIDAIDVDGAIRGNGYSGAYDLPAKALQTSCLPVGM